MIDYKCGNYTLYGNTELLLQQAFQDAYREGILFHHFQKDSANYASPSHYIPEQEV